MAPIKTNIYIIILQVSIRVSEESTAAIVKRYINREGCYLLTGWHCLITQKPKYEFLCFKGTRVVFTGITDPALGEENQVFVSNFVA
jgi:hypothetical protein